MCWFLQMPGENTTDFMSQITVDSFLVVLETGNPKIKLMFGLVSAEAFVFVLQAAVTCHVFIKFYFLLGRLLLPLFIPSFIFLARYQLHRDQYKKLVLDLSRSLKACLLNTITF